METASGCTRTATAAAVPSLRGPPAAPAAAPAAAAAPPPAAAAAAAAARGAARGGAEVDVLAVHNVMAYGQINSPINLAAASK